MLDKNLEQQIYQDLQERIFKGELRAQEHISDSQIAKKWNTSRTPVRDALKKLEYQGILRREPSKGWYVRPLLLEDIKDIFEVKIEIEGMMAYKAASCTDETLRETLKSAYEDMRSTDTDTDLGHWQEADRLFHETMANMAGNKRASRILNELNALWNRVRVAFACLQSFREDSNTTHKLILDAVLKGEAEEARRHMQEHVRTRYIDTEKILVNLILPFAINGL